MISLENLRVSCITSILNNSIKMRIQISICHHKALYLNEIVFVFSFLYLFSVECTINKYGQDCRQSCGNCTKGEQCNHVNGSCPNGCDAGVTGENCDTGKLVINKVYEIHKC